MYMSPRCFFHVWGCDAHDKTFTLLTPWAVIKDRISERWLELQVLWIKPNINITLWFLQCINPIWLVVCTIDPSKVWWQELISEICTKTITCWLVTICTLLIYLDVMSLNTTNCSDLKLPLIIDLLNMKCLTHTEPSKSCFRAISITWGWRGIAGIRFNTASIHNLLWSRCPAMWRTWLVSSMYVISACARQPV